MKPKRRENGDGFTVAEKSLMLSLFSLALSLKETVSVRSGIGLFGVTDTKTHTHSLSLSLFLFWVFFLFVCFFFFKHLDCVSVPAKIKHTWKEQASFWNRRWALEITKQPLWVQTWDVTKWGFVVVDETVISVIGVMREASDWLVFSLVSQPAVHEWSHFYSDSAGLGQKYEFCIVRRVVGSLDSQLMNVVALSLPKKTKSALKSSLRMYDKINGSLDRSHLNYWGGDICSPILLVKAVRIQL